MFHSNMRSMVEFAMALMAKLELLNTHSFNSFKLRIGQNTYLLVLSNKQTLKYKIKTVNLALCANDVLMMSSAIPPGLNQLTL